MSNLMFAFLNSSQRRQLVSSARTVPAVLGLMALGMGSLLTGCSALDVNNPTAIESTTLDNATGATYLWTDARLSFARAISTAADRSGRFADESFVEVDPNDLAGFDAAFDFRQSAEIATQYGGDEFNYGNWQLTRRNATVALGQVRAFSPPGVREARLSELFAIRGFSALRLAEDICPGFPLNDIVNFTPVYNPPLTTNEVLEHAIAQFDSALAYGGDSARVMNFARVGKARALLNLGKYAEAAEVAAEVSPEYVATIVPPYNEMNYLEGPRRSVSDREGINGLDFISAHDPRVVVTPYAYQLFGDTTAQLYTNALYPERYSPIVVASKIEADLIIAEAQLQPATNPNGSWLTTLNALRSMIALPDTTDPGTARGRVDLLFRERAFWLFQTGHRLGDLRRLVRQYGRDPETVFPTGPYRTGGAYSTGTRLPFPVQTESIGNPTVTGCTDT
jgi:starch-binding outer membrane protein, SusD/RagB family